MDDKVHKINKCCAWRVLSSTFMVKMLVWNLWFLVECIIWDLTKSLSWLTRVPALSNADSSPPPQTTSSSLTSIYRGTKAFTSGMSSLLHGLHRPVRLARLCGMSTMHRSVLRQHREFSGTFCTFAQSTSDVIKNIAVIGAGELGSLLSWTVRACF